MADNIFSAITSSEVECYNNGLQKTILQIEASAAIGLKVIGWSICFDGTSVTSEPVEIEIMRQVDYGTMAGIGASKLKPVAEQVQASIYYSATTEPTYGDVLDYIEVHPQAGADIKYSIHDMIIVPPSGRIALVVKSPDYVNCVAKIICEE